MVAAVEEIGVSLVCNSAMYGNVSVVWCDVVLWCMVAVVEEIGVSLVCNSVQSLADGDGGTPRSSHNHVAPHRYATRQLGQLHIRTLLFKVTL